MNLEQQLFGVTFKNPVLLASGTCGYGEEMQGFFDINELGGVVLKAVTSEAREGNPAPRVIEYDAGMLNSVGLANAGLAEVKRSKLPWLARHASGTHVFVNVAGKSVEEFAQIITALDDAEQADRTPVQEWLALLPRLDVRLRNLEETRESPLRQVIEVLTNLPWSRDPAHARQLLGCQRLGVRIS